jgi:HSP20 family protein
MAMDRRRGLTGSSYVPLRDAMDRLMEGSFVPGFGGQGGFPPTDMYTTDDSVVVCVAIPGAKADDIHASITGETVTISGQVSQTYQAGQTQNQGQSQQSQKTGQQGQQRGRQIYFEEIWTGQFQRSFSLPFEVNADKADATFDNGILTLKLPKSEAAKPRRIQVKTSQGQISGQSNGQDSTQRETVSIQSGSSS